MSDTEVSYSTIEEGETGKLFSVSVPYDPFDLPSLSLEEQRALARRIHNDIQRQLEQWFDEEFLTVQ